MKAMDMYAWPGSAKTKYKKNKNEINKYYLHSFVLIKKYAEILKAIDPFNTGIKSNFKAMAWGNLTFTTNIVKYHTKI